LELFNSWLILCEEKKPQEGKTNRPPVTYLTSSSHGIEEQTRLLQEHGIQEEGNEEGRWLPSLLLLLLRQTHDLSRRCRKRPPVPMTVPPRNILFWNREVSVIAVVCCGKTLVCLVGAANDLEFPRPFHNVMSCSGTRKVCRKRPLIPTTVPLRNVVFWTMKSPPSLLWRQNPPNYSHYCRI
jgi:hypothetical protein